MILNLEYFVFFSENKPKSTILPVFVLSGKFITKKGLIKIILDYVEI